jgi:hypothetical protein
MALYNAKPLIFLEEAVPDNGSCVIHSGLWSQWSTQINELMLVKITYDSNTYFLHVHSFHNQEQNSIFLPNMCFNSESDINVQMELVEEMPPVATKITLQPLDSEIYHCDIAKAVSEHLSNWQVLSVGTTLTVPCEELGGFLVDVFVKAIEPAETVLLRGEVPLELDEPLETVAEWVKKTTPPAQRSPSPHPQAISSIQGLFPEVVEASKKTGFVPFSGKGYSLI